MTARLPPIGAGRGGSSGGSPTLPAFTRAPTRTFPAPSHLHLPRIFLPYSDVPGGQVAPSGCVPHCRAPEAAAGGDGGRGRQGRRGRSALWLEWQAQRCVALVHLACSEWHWASVLLRCHSWVLNVPAGLRQGRGPAAADREPAGKPSTPAALCSPPSRLLHRRDKVQRWKWGGCVAFQMHAGATLLRGLMLPMWSLDEHTAFYVLWGGA